MIELACYTKECAPPPVGTGGSVGGQFDIEWISVRRDEDYPTDRDLEVGQSVWDNQVPKIPEPLLEWISETGGPYQRLKGREGDDRIWDAKAWAVSLLRGGSESLPLYQIMTQTEQARRALSLALHDPDGPTPQEAQWYAFVHQAYLERSAQLGTPKDLQYVTRDVESSDPSDPFAPNEYWKSKSEAPDAEGTGITSWFGVTNPPSDRPPKAALVPSKSPITTKMALWSGWVSKDQVLGVFGDTPGELLVARDAATIDRLTGRSATTASGLIELACRSKACAPPPIGTGGSIKGELPGVVDWVSGVEAEGQIPVFDPESEVGKRVDELIATFEAERDDRELKRVDGRWESADLDSLPAATTDPYNPDWAEAARSRWSMLTQSEESRKWLSRTVREGASGPDLVILQVIHENFRRRFLNPDIAKVPVNRISDADAPTDDPFAPGSYWKRESADPDAAGTGLTSWTWGRKDWVDGYGFDFTPYGRGVEEQDRGGRPIAQFWNGDVPVSDVLGWFGDMAWEGEIIVGRPGLVQRLLKGEPSEKANAALTASALTELACRSAECAPPPVGSGGSLSVDDFAWDGTTVPMPPRFAERERATDGDRWLAEVPVLPRPLLEWAATGANLADLPSIRGTSGKGAEIVAKTAQRILNGEDTPNLHAELWYGLVLTGTSRKALSRAIHEGPSVEEQGLFRIVHEHYLRTAEGLVGDGDAQPVQRHDWNNRYQEGDEPIGPFDPSSHWKGRGARPAAPGTRVTSWFGMDHIPYDYPIKSTDQATDGARQRWVGDVSKRQVLGRFGDTANELLVAESPEIIDRLLGRSATTASALIDLACRSKACAPPPVGEGGSLPAGTGIAGVTQDGLSANRTLHEVLLPSTGNEADAWKAGVAIMAEGISDTGVSVEAFADVFADGFVNEELATVLAGSSLSPSVPNDPNITALNVEMIGRSIEQGLDWEGVPVVLNAAGKVPVVLTRAGRPVRLRGFPAQGTPISLDDYTRFISHYPKTKTTHVFYIHNRLRNEDGSWAVPSEVTEYGGPTDATGTESLGARRAVAAAIRGAWAQSARGTLSNMASMSVANMGLASHGSWVSLGRYLDPKVLDRTTLLRGMRPAVDQAIRAAYDATQAQLKSLGITEITVYRGARYQSVAGVSAGDTAQVAEASLSSWTTDPYIADDFASYGDGDGPRPSPRDGRIIEMTVPASRVFSTAQTGLGSQLEGEVVLLGSDSDDVRVYNRATGVPREWKNTPKPVAAAATDDTPVFLDADPDHHDWIKVVRSRRRPDAASIMDAITAACRSAECAPPPVGTGGSLPEGTVTRPSFTEHVSSWEPTNAWPEEQALSDIFEHDLGNGVVTVIDDVNYPDLESDPPEFAVTVTVVKNNRSIGTAKRRLIFPGAEMTDDDVEMTDIGPGVVAHDDFSISDLHQGEGIGGAFIAASMQAAADADFDLVSTEAVSGPNTNGIYTWLRAGFTIEAEPNYYQVQRVNERLSAAGYEPRFTSDWSGQELLDYLGDDAKEVLGARNDTLTVGLSLHYDLTQLRTPKAVAASAAMDRLTEALSEWLEPIAEESTTASALIELACYSKACAPPPVGDGGSLPEAIPTSDANIEEYKGLFKVPSIKAIQKAVGGATIAKQVEHFAQYGIDLEIDEWAYDRGHPHETYGALYGLDQMAQKYPEAFKGMKVRIDVRHAREDLGMFQWPSPENGPDRVMTINVNSRYALNQRAKPIQYRRLYAAIVIHETAHVLTYDAVGRDRKAMLSLVENDRPRQVGGQTLTKGSLRQSVSEYGTSSIGEDIAESFTAHTLGIEITDPVRKEWMAQHVKAIAASGAARRDAIAYLYAMAVAEDDEETSATASALIELACRSKSCAPPPVGTGGSVSSGYTEAIAEVRRRYGPGTKPRNRADIGQQMHNLLDLRFSKSPPPSDDEVWEMLTESKEARSMVSRALMASDPDPLAITVMQEAHRRIVAEMPEHMQTMVWRSGRRTSPPFDPFSPISGPHGSVLRDNFGQGTGVTSWWGPPPTDGSKPEDDYRISDQVRAGVMAPGENFQDKYRNEAGRLGREVFEEWVGSDRILGRLGDMRHSGEMLVAHTSETISRLMSGTFPIVPAENRVSNWSTVGSANVIELACRSKECAPPPVGTGGSLPADSGLAPIDVEQEDYSSLREDRMGTISLGRRLADWSIPVDDEFVAEVQRRVEESPVAVRMEAHTFEMMANDDPDPKIRNVYEAQGAADHKGHMYMQVRTAYDAAVGLLPLRTIHGYSAFDATIGVEELQLQGSSASWYGQVELILHDSVKDRAYFTVGDSLNTLAIPLPIRGEIDPEHSATQRVQKMSPYVEVQIPGPIPLSEVAEISVGPDWSAEDYIDGQALARLVRAGLSPDTRLTDSDGTRTVAEHLDDFGIAA